MKLGYYYHVPISIKGGQLSISGYMGVFLESIAAHVETLVLFLHEANATEAMRCDYVLKAKNVVWVSLGRKTPAWHRAIFHRSLLGPVSVAASDLDYLLLRSPSPLAPYFSSIKELRGRIVYMVVSDYGKGADCIIANSLRSWAVRAYCRWNDKIFKKRLAGQLVIANSREIFECLESHTNHLYEVKTTTLSEDDFFERKDTCLKLPIRLLFTGRIVFDKGLRELIKAASKLAKAGIRVEVHFVGWEEVEGSPVQSAMIELAGQQGISDSIYFHGFKSVGAELNEMYRMADIFVLPSYHEGFPRTIWEAMANCLPVIATTVGSIPNYLLDGRDALLIPPKDEDALFNAIHRLVEDDGLRQRLIQAGLLLAQDNTLDRQASKLIALLAKHSQKL